LRSGRVRGSEAWEEKALEGHKPRRVSTVGERQLNPTRTDSQEDESFGVHGAGGTDRFRRMSPRWTGKRAFGRDEREAIVV